MTRKTQAAPRSINVVAKRMIARRAVDAMLWGMPIVNYDFMYQAMTRLGGGFNQIVRRER